MNIGLFSKKFEDGTKNSLQNLVNALENNDVNVSVYETFYNLIKNDITFSREPQIFGDDSISLPELDFVFSIGGDGTLLKTVAWLGNRNIPIVGVNMGHLGFLTTVGRGEAADYVPKLIQGNYTIENRSLLHVEYGGGSRFVLNEVGLHRDKPLTLLSIDVYVDGEFLATYSGDGLIVASPTGSTAYSLSCGGPILSPNSNCIVLTPVAVHTLTFRPIILPDTSQIKLVTHSKTDSMCLGLDSESLTVSASTEINISKETFGIQLVRMEQQSFYSALRDKLMWGVDKRQ